MEEEEDDALNRGGDVSLLRRNSAEFRPKNSAEALKAWGSGKMVDEERWVGVDDGRWRR